jgi:hypothetical protein
MLIRRDGGGWREPSQTAYLDESELQELLAGSPDLIPGTDESLVTVREFPVETGAVDLVGVSPAGQIVLCECKLERNEEARRKVVGQILSYAGALWRMPLEEFLRRFESRASRPLVELAARHALAGDWREEAWRQALTERLDAAAFRLVVVVDAISQELRRTITMLNANTTDTFSLVALELAYQRDGEIELLTPQSYGMESTETRGRQTRRIRRWDEPQFLGALEMACTPSELRAANELYRALTEICSDVKFGTGSSPSASFVFDAPVPPTSVFSLYTTPGEGCNLAVNFAFLEGRVGRTFLQEFLERTRRLPGAGDRFSEVERRDFRARPGIPGRELFAEAGAVEQVVDIARWVGNQPPASAESHHDDTEDLPAP